MVRPTPHPLTVFSLIPWSPRAEDVVDHPENQHLVSLVPGAPSRNNEGGEPRGLNIGFHIGSRSRYTLATLGRNGDIFVEGSNIPRIQCSFEIHQDTDEIMLYDRSTSRSTQTIGEKAMPFVEERRERYIVVGQEEDVNNEFGFGSQRDPVRFRVHWHDQEFNYKEEISYREDHPRFTRTVDDETPTALPSMRATRIHTPVVQTAGVQGRVKKIRYYKKKQIGKGSFGEVWKAVDVDTGKFFALKLVKWPDLQSREYTALKREVEYSAGLSHPNIVEFISAQGYGGPHLEILLELKDGNINALIHSNHFKDEPRSATRLLHDMLKALDYLAFKGIVHRDVKPANILLTCLPTGGYTFSLTDFGLCNLISDAQTFAGSLRYIAPEVFSNPGTGQTSKVDVWSLFVTLAEARDVDGFRRKRFNTSELRIRAVEEATRNPEFYPLRDMVIVDPSRRASAGEMLDMLFNGEGRSTPRNEIQDGGRLAAASKPQLEPRKDGGRLVGASKRQPEPQKVAKPSKPHHPQRPRVKCPGCQFEGEKESVKLHAIFYGHIQRRIPSDIIEDN